VLNNNKALKEMTKDEAIQVINACLAINVDVTFIESKVETGHMVRFSEEDIPILTYSVAITKLQSLKSEERIGT
jgi:hypothetical protein